MGYLVLPWKENTIFDTVPNFSYNFITLVDFVLV